MAEAARTESLPIYLYGSPNSTFNVVIGKSNLGGRGLFATTDIKKGSLVFVNEPTVYGPRANCDTKKFCSNCYQISDLCYPCGKCYAYICSVCDKSSYHIQLCSFIDDNWRLKSNINAVEEISVIIARVVIYLRYLLLSEGEKCLLETFQRTQIKGTFEELKTLQSTYFIPEHHVEYINIVESINKINSFRISHSIKSKTIELRGLYPLSAFMNHSCIPNTRNVFRKNYSMAVYATEDIKKGDEITSCYTGLLWCTPARRCQLYKSKNFWCKCRRCRDETEKGTRLSAMRCLKKPCVGVLLPKNPLHSQTKWSCDACNVSVSAEKINMIQSALGSLVGTLKLDDEFRMENRIIRRLAIFIPYSNHIFVDIRLRLALRLGFRDDHDIKGTSN